MTIDIPIVMQRYYRTLSKESRQRQNLVGYEANYRDMWKTLDQVHLRRDVCISISRIRLRALIYL